MAWIAFAVGLLIGSFAGMLAIGLCQMAARSEIKGNPEHREGLYPSIKTSSLAESTK